MARAKSVLEPTRDLPFAQVLPQAPAVPGKPAVLRGWSSWRKEDLGNPQCERANVLFCFNLGNASYVVFYFPFFFSCRAEEKLQIQVKKPQTFAFLSFSHICHGLDLPAVLK